MDVEPLARGAALSSRSYRVHTTPLSPLNPPPVGDFSKPIMSSKSPRMGDLGGEKVCNEANLDLWVHGNSSIGRGILENGDEQHFNLPTLH